MKGQDVVNLFALLGDLLRVSLQQSVGSDYLDTLTKHFQKWGLKGLASWLQENRLSEKATQAVLSQAQQCAGRAFRERGAWTLYGYARELGIEDLPRLEDILQKIPSSAASPVALRQALLEVLRQDWRGLEPAQYRLAADIYADCLMRALFDVAHASVAGWLTGQIALDMRHELEKLKKMLLQARSRLPQGVRLEVCPPPHTANPFIPWALEVLKRNTLVVLGPGADDATIRGVGFFLAPNGAWALTSAQALHEAGYREGLLLRVRAEGDWDRPFEAYWERTLPDFKVALLRIPVDKKPRGLRGLPLWKAFSARGATSIGNPFLGWGYHDDQHLTGFHVQGSIEGEAKRGPRRQTWLHVKTEAHPRVFLGSPVVDLTKGRVVGMVAQEESQGLYFVVTAEDMALLGREIDAAFRKPEPLHVPGVTVDPWPEPEHRIGHDEELEKGCAWMTELISRNQGGLLVVAGPAGYGRHALAREILQRLAQQRGLFWAETSFATSADGLTATIPENLRLPQTLPWGVLLLNLHEKIGPLSFPRQTSELARSLRELLWRQRQPLALLLHDVHLAADMAWGWWEEPAFLALMRSYPLFVVLTYDPLDLEEERREALQALVDRLGPQGLSLSMRRLRQDEVRAFPKPPPPPEVVERLWRWSDGIPYLVLDIWRSWTRGPRPLLRLRDDQRGWEIAENAQWVAIFDGEEYLRKVLDEYMEGEPPPPWSREQVEEMLRLAALEGPVFTLDALAQVYGIPVEQLEEEWTLYLLDEPDEETGTLSYGLWVFAGETDVSEALARSGATVLRYRFRPLLVYHTLQQRPLPPRERIEALGEALHRLYWNRIRLIGPVLVRIFEAAGRPDRAEEYRRWLRSGQPPQDIRLLLKSIDLLEMMATQHGDPLAQEDDFPPRGNIELGQIPTAEPRDVEPSTVVVSQLLDKYHDLANALYENHDAQDALRRFQRMLGWARWLPNRGMEATALWALGSAYLARGYAWEALGRLQEALAIVREVKNRRGEGGVLAEMSRALITLGRPEEALERLHEALAVAREEQDRRGEGVVLATMGRALIDLGRPEEALTRLHEALAIYREVQDRRGEGAVLLVMGQALKALGRPEEALTRLQEALVVFREVKGRRGEGVVLYEMGRALKALGRPEEALCRLAQALDIFMEIKSFEDVALQLIQRVLMELYDEFYLLDKGLLREDAESVYVLNLDTLLVYLRETCRYSDVMHTEA